MDLHLSRDFIPRHGEAVEVAPGIRRVTAPNPGPFTFLGTNSFLVGQQDLMVIDPGPDDLAHLGALVQAVGSARVAGILLSHTHGDHCGAAPALQERTGAPILAARRSAGSQPAFQGELQRPAPAVDTASVGWLVDGQIISWDGGALEVVATPGHAADHVAFAVLGRNILLSGDHVMGWSTTVVAPPDGSMVDYMASLEKLLARPERLYLPAHGGAIADGPTFVRGLIAHRHRRELAILDRLAMGDRTIGEIVARIYPGLEAGLLRGASLSTLAHLEALVDRGLVWSDPGLTLIARYGLAGSVGAMPATGTDPTAFGSG